MYAIVAIALRRLRAPLLVLITAYAVSTVVLTLIPGVDAQGNPWRMDFLHAFYFVSYTASTVGFGEIPHPFTPMQRLWTTVSMYMTVFAWLYTIGSALGLVQDPAFKQAVVRRRFAQVVQRLPEPFYVICGYGDTGQLLVRALVERGTRVVVVDDLADNINELHLQDLRLHVPGLAADANEVSTLVDAGLAHASCMGVVALTNDDHVNLKIAITAKLLNPSLTVVCRADSHEPEANMKSFGTDHVINPFDSFADRLALAIHSPSMFLIYEWLTGVPHTSLPGPLCPPRGTWILCGYGRLGRAVRRYLEYEGVESVAIEHDPEATQGEESVTVGPATEAVTLRDAQIEKAAGIVAGTDDDADNLSIIMTARELNPNIYCVARQNRRDNDALFRAADLDIVMQRSDIIAHKILAFLTAPMLADFLRLARHQRKEWTDELASRLIGILEERVPDVWAVRLDKDTAPALLEAHRNGYPATLEHLLAHPRERDSALPCIALLMRRGEERLLPTSATEVEPEDEILFCGREGVAALMQWTLQNWNVLRYVQTGEVVRESYVWRWLAGPSG